MTGEGRSNHRKDMMDNPYKRLRQLTKISQLDFADKYGLSKTTMTYIESGQYPDLSDYMIESLGRECVEKNIDAKAILFDEYSSLSLSDAYHRWQTTERMQSAYKFREVAPRASDGDTSPMEQFITDVSGSTQGFCKLLKVPAASVSRYAKGEGKAMPKVLKNALHEVQYQYMDELINLQEVWRLER